MMVAIIGLSASGFASAEQQIASVNNNVITHESESSLIPAPKPERSDYPNIGVSSRSLVWVIAQMHLFFGALVLAVPMYNMGIPSTLKAWIDRVARAGRTFRYTANGPEGLVKGMKTYVLFARGGQYYGTPLDTQTGYLKGILGLMGITDIETVYAENLARGGDTREESLSEARDLIGQLVGATALEAQYAIA